MPVFTGGQAALIEVILIHRAFEVAVEEIQSLHGDALLLIGEHDVVIDWVRHRSMQKVISCLGQSGVDKVS